MPVSGGFTSCNCGPDVEACEQPTEPAATVGLCLPDGTPIAVVVTRDCAGTVTQDGWINLTTGAWSAGAPPAGAAACGESRSIQVSGILCDVDDDGGVLGLVLVEYEYAPDGTIANVRLVDATTGTTYTSTGTVTVCPAGAAADEPEQDLVVLCDLVDEGTVTPFLRDYRRDASGAVVGHSDYALDGTPYTPAGTVGTCAAGSGEPCRNSTSLLLCDLDTSSASGQPTATDSPTNFAPPDDTVVYTQVPGGQTLWDGGAVTVGPDTAPPAPATIVHRYLDATLQADRPYCDSGTATVTASVEVELAGPGAGCLGVGFLRLYHTDGTLLASTGVDSSPPVGHVQTLTVTAAVDADALAAGDVHAYLFLETYHSSPTCPEPYDKAWQVRAFTAEFAYGTAGCGTQFLRTVTTDCATGAVIAVSDTTLDGQPYTAAGVVGQCEPAGSGQDGPVQQPGVDVESTVWCVRTPDGGVTGHVLLESVYDHTGQRIEQRTVDPTTGEPVALPDGAELVVCGDPATGGGESPGDEPCLGSTTVLLCQQSTPQDTTGDATAAVTDPGPFNAWSGYGQPTDDTWCQAPGDAGGLFTGGTTTLGPGEACPDGAASMHHVIAATLTADTDGCEQVEVTASVDVLLDGPVAGYGADGIVGLWDVARRELLASQRVRGNAPVGHEETITLTATVPGATLTAGQVAVSVDLETDDRGAKTWAVSQFTATYSGSCAVTSQFLRHTATDCDGTVVEQRDTDLDGQPITVTGEIGQCSPAASGPGCCGQTPASGNIVATDLMCVEDADGALTGQVLVERVYDGQTGQRLEQRHVDPTTGATVQLPDGARLVVCGDPAPDDESPGDPGLCRTTTSVHLCDLDDTGATGSLSDGGLTATDTDPSPYDSDHPATRPLDGGGQALWDGGSLAFPAEAGGIDGEIDAYRTVAATLQADRPACDDGTATVTASVQLSQGGPGNGRGWCAYLRLYTSEGDTGVVGRQTLRAIPAGWQGRVEVSAEVPAEVLAAGQLVAVLMVETFHGDGKAWTASDFRADFAFGQAGCQTEFLRTLVMDCDTGSVVQVVDSTLDGQPYTSVGTVGQCCTCTTAPGDPSAGPGGQGCSTSSTTLPLCDIPTDGDGLATAVDTAPDSYDSSTSMAPLPGGGQALWDGGSLTFPADPDGSAGSGTDVMRAVAARVQAPRPACDDGTVRIIASVDVTQDGPGNARGLAGYLRLFQGTAQAASFPIRATPAGTSLTLVADAEFPAHVLAAGEIAVLLALETWHGDGKAWTASNARVAYSYVLGGCVTPVLRTVTVACDGTIVSVADTDMDGVPYEPTGRIGQCSEPALPPAGGAAGAAAAVPMTARTGIPHDTPVRAHALAAAGPALPAELAPQAGPDLLAGPTITGGLARLVGGRITIPPGAGSVTVTVLAGAPRITIGEVGEVPVPAGAPPLTWQAEPGAVLGDAYTVTAGESDDVLINVTTPVPMEDSP